MPVVPEGNGFTVPSGNVIAIGFPSVTCGRASRVSISGYIGGREQRERRQCPRTPRTEPAVAGAGLHAGPFTISHNGRLTFFLRSSFPRSPFPRSPFDVDKGRVRKIARTGKKLDEERPFGERCGQWILLIAWKQGEIGFE